MKQHLNIYSIDFPWLTAKQMYRCLYLCLYVRCVYMYVHGMCEAISRGKFVFIEYIYIYIHSWIPTENFPLFHSY